MIGSFNFHRSQELAGTTLKTSCLSNSTQSTVYFVGKYFVSSAHPAAKSDVDYLKSPMEQIRDQINAWRATLGSRTRVEAEDATLLVAPALHIPQEHFDSYEPVFAAVMLYRAQAAESDDTETGTPSEEQTSAALLGLANLVSALVPAPSPMFLEDGTIGAYWRRGERYASIDFEIDGEHTWAGTDGKTFRSGIWKVSAGHLPAMLMQELLTLGSCA